MNSRRPRNHARRAEVVALTGLTALALVLAVPGASAAPLASAQMPDTQPPSVPQGQVVVVAARSATMRWNASSDNVGVAGYRLFKNGVRVATTKARTFTYLNLRCRTTYTFALAAFDAAGNVSNRAEATGIRTTRACPAATTKPQAKPKPKQKPRTRKRPVGSTLANLWVDPSGGSCVRRATAGRWRPAEACSWNQAYGKARSGDLILVRGGDYGNVTIGPDRSGVNGIVFRTSKGERAVVRDFENGHVAGSAGASNVSFLGPVTARTFRSDKASNVVVGGWRIDCGGCIGEQTFHIEDANNVTVRNSDIGNNTDNSLMWISGSNLRFENNRIHDAGLRPGSGAHTECMYAWRVTNLTLKRNHFFHCAVMDVFITGGEVAQGGLVENNVFEQPWEYTGRISRSALAFHFRNGDSPPSPDPNDWDFRHNTFVGSLSITTDANPVGASGMRIIGNVFLAGAPSCSVANTTWTNNAFVSGGCGANRMSHPLGTYLAGFVGTGDPGNYSLRSNSVLRDRGDSTNHPLRDRAGKLRSGRPDVGAYEFR